MCIIARREARKKRAACGMPLQLDMGKAGGMVVFWRALKLALLSKLAYFHMCIFCK
jgi:hypothetical protein